jgi:protein SCO1/2
MAMLGASPLAAALMSRVVRGSTLEGIVTPKPQKKWREVSGRQRFKERHLPDVALITHDGKKVNFYEDLVKDKMVLINFMYAKCEGVCPGVTANLLRVQKALGERVGKDIFMYSITLKPEQDTPEVLKKYAEAYKVRKGWTFLTGTPENIELLRRKLGFTDPDPQLDADKTNHIGNVRYGNEALQLWGACPGLSNASFIAESLLWLDWPKNKNVSGKGVGE